LRVGVGAYCVEVTSTVEMVCVPGNVRAGGELANAQYSYEKQVSKFLAVHNIIIDA